MELTFRLNALTVENTAPAPRAPKTSWPLMGDIVSHRMDIPEHLIQWRRAMNEDDPMILPSGTKDL